MTDREYKSINKEEQKIDIQSIEELSRETQRITASASNPHDYGITVGYDVEKLGSKINEVIRAIKQLDKKIK